MQQGVRVALAGQMGGAIHLSLIFLLLFLSRKKEEKEFKAC
jgi:hypothetical protein